MAEQQVSTPQSSNDADPNGPKIPKDRRCPFCQQPFTSSSLGRHLDLYIKPKNAKPPDGIHNVEEIRRLRGNITRRQSRVSSVKRDSSASAVDPGPSTAPTDVVRSSQYGATAQDSDAIANSAGMVKMDAQQRYEKMFSVKLNRPSWESTGVMNDLPPRVDPLPDIRREVSRHTQLKVDSEQRNRLADELDSGRAAELALKEVLASVRDANAQQTARGVFDFDFFSCNFPSLCLRLLPAPPTIHSPTPFATNESWSFNPPSEQQYDAVHVAIQDHGKVYLRQSQARHHSLPATQNLAKTMDMHKFFLHASDAFNHWNSLSNEQRQQTWQQEILRSFAHAEDARKDAQTMADTLRQQVDHLTLQLENRQRRFHGTEFGPEDTKTSQHQTSHLPYAALTSLKLSTNLMKEICKQGVDFRDWDYERLVDKWKPVVRDERRAVNGLEGQIPLSSSTSRHVSNPGTAHLQRPNGQAINTQFSRSTSIASALSVHPAPPTRTDSMDSGEGDADAEEDDADADADHEIPTASMGGGGVGSGGVGEMHQQRLRPPNLTPLNQAPHPHTQHPSFAHSLHQQTLQSPTNHASPTNHGNAMYQWPGAGGMGGGTGTQHGVQARSGFPQIKNLPPGPTDWQREMNHAVMEGLEGPAAAGVAGNRQQGGEDP